VRLHFDRAQWGFHLGQASLQRFARGDFSYD
jgi:hypothetical protein